MTKEKVKVNGLSKMVVPILVIGKTISQMVWVNSLGEVVKSMRESFLMAKDMEMALTNMLMAHSE